MNDSRLFIMHAGVELKYSHWFPIDPHLHFLRSAAGVSTYYEWGHGRLHQPDG